MWRPDDVLKVLCNPFYAINIDPDLAVEHPPLQSREEWVAANAKALQEVGAEKWLHTLLEVLSGGFIAAGGPGPGPGGLGPPGGPPPPNRQERRRRQREK